MSRPDPFEQYKAKYGAAPTTSDDPFASYAQKYGVTVAAEPEPPKRGLLDRLKEAVSPRAHLDAAKMLIQGATLGAGDEMRAAIRSVPALMPGGERPQDAYARLAAEESGDVRRIREANPVASMVAEGAGSLVPMAFTGGGSAAIGAARATPRALPSAGRAIAESAAVGGAYGFNEGEGGVGNRLIGGAVGATAGAVGAGALTAATLPLSRPVAGAVGRGVVGAAAGAAIDSEDRTRGALIGGASLAAAPMALQRLKAMGRVGAVGDDIARVTDPASRPNQPAQFSERSLVQILRSLRDDNPDLDLGDLAARAPGEAAPVSILEQGANTRGLGRASVTVGGRAKQEIPEALAERGKGQGDRIRDIFLNRSGVGKRVDPKLALQEQNKLRNQQGAAAYGEVWAENPGGIADERIASLLDDIDAGVPGGSVREQVDELVGYMVRRKQAAPEDFVQDGAPTLRYLDLYKQAAQRRVKFAKRDPELARKFDDKTEDLVKGALREYVDELDNLTGGEASKYRAARNRWGDDTEVMAAIEDADDFLRVSEREVAAAKAEMSESAWDAYRQIAIDKTLGYADNVTDRADLTTRKPFDLDVPATQRKLRLLFDDDAEWAAFQREMAGEVEMARSLRSVTGGSNTADKLAEVGRLFGVPIEELVTPGGQAGVIRQLVQTLAERGRAGYTTRAADDLVAPLTAGMRGDKENYIALTRRLKELAEEEARRGRLVQPAARGVGAVGGSLSNR